MFGHCRLERGKLAAYLINSQQVGNLTGRQLVAPDFESKVLSVVAAVWLIVIDKLQSVWLERHRHPQGSGKIMTLPLETSLSVANTQIRLSSALCTSLIRMMMMRLGLCADDISSCTKVGESHGSHIFEPPSSEYIQTKFQLHYNEAETRLTCNNSNNN